MMKYIKSNFSKSLAICLTLIAPAKGFAQGKDINLMRANVARAEMIYETAPFPSCHASTIVETADGLLAAWFGGTAEKNPDVCIYVANKSTDKGWTAPIKVADGVESATVRYPTWNPVLFKKDNGDIVLYYKVGPDPKKWWGMYKVSKDNGKTWGEAVKIPNNLLGPIKNKPVRLSDSRILYPTSFEDDQKWNVYLETSDQNLQNWKKIEIDNAGLNAIQPSVLFYADGSMQLLNRSRNQKITETWSKDNGKTWSPLALTNLPNNNSGTDAVTLENGMQLLIYNPMTRGRNKIALAGSFDGKVWKDLLVLEDYPKGEFSYPAIIQGKDGKVHITYTYHRKKIKYLAVDIVEVK